MFFFCVKLQFSSTPKTVALTLVGGFIPVSQQLLMLPCLAVRCSGIFVVVPMWGFSSFHRELFLALAVLVN